jgi:hypothetical protein
MTKGLTFGGKGLSIVCGSQVQEKKGTRTGTVQNIRFSPRTIVPTKYQVKWDDGLITWVNAKLVKPNGNY